MVSLHFPDPSNASIGYSTDESCNEYRSTRDEWGILHAREGNFGDVSSCYHDIIDSTQNWNFTNSTHSWPHAIEIVESNEIVIACNSVNGVVIRIVSNAQYSSCFTGVIYLVNRMYRL